MARALSSSKRREHIETRRVEFVEAQPKVRSTFSEETATFAGTGSYDLDVICLASAPGRGHAGRRLIAVLWGVHCTAKCISQPDRGVHGALQGLRAQDKCCAGAL